MTAEVFIKHRQQRVRCTDEQFLEAIYTSKTYAEIAEKTGQKIPSTMARYGRVKKALSARGIDIPSMNRKPTEKTTNNVDNMVKIVQRLREHHRDM